jgi:hypothetical protein
MRFLFPLQSNWYGLLAIGLLGIAACSDGPERASAIAEAFAGPMSLNIRGEISLKSPVVATVKHGDKLEVLQMRRRFMRVRTEAGVEGWCDSERLLTTEQMDRLHAVSSIAAKLPVQGEGTVFDARNVHTEPHRLAPSFYQLKEEERFAVLGHRLVERGPYKSDISKMIEQASGAAPRKKKPAKVKEKEPRKDGDVELPEPPGAPAAPANWQDLSYRLPPPEPEEKPADDRPQLLLTPPKEPPKFEDWSLIRNKDGRAGWILTRSIAMTIPDDVARYAEGHRITSWFPLGEVTDGEVTKKHYLWTTIVRGGEPYEFDGFRVFIYNARRHRYETAYREKEIRGYMPAAVHDVEVTANKKTLRVPGFSLIVENGDGQQVRKTFAFEGYRVRLVNVEPWTKLEDPLDAKALAIARPSPKPAAAEQPVSWWQRLKDKLPFVGKS